MPEINNSGIRIYGLPPEQHPIAIELIQQGAIKALEGDKSKLIPAELKPDSLSSLRVVEETAHDYFRTKFRRLGLQNSETIPFPPVYYAKKNKTTKDKEGEMILSRKIIDTKKELIWLLPIVLIVGWIIISIILPVYSLTNTL